MQSTMLDDDYFDDDDEIKNIMRTAEVVYTNGLYADRTNIVEDKKSSLKSLKTVSMNQSKETTLKLSERFTQDQKYQLQTKFEKGG